MDWGGDHDVVFMSKYVRVTQWTEWIPSEDQVAGSTPVAVIVTKKVI